MARERDRRIVVWPLYFDRDLKRSDGRRVSLELSVPSPTIEVIFSVCKKLGLSPEIQDEKSHPCSQTSQKGRVLVKKTKNKQRLLAEIGRGLQKSAR